MLNLKLKQAKAAFDDGRLDEAQALVFAGNLLNQRGGQKLAKKLAAALIVRGNAHLQESRLDSALSDCNKAEKLAGNLTDAAKLRADICKAIEENRFVQAKQRAVIENARANIDNGMVSVGRAILQKAPESAQAAMLDEQASVIGAKTAAVIKKANAAIKRNDLDNAVKILSDAKLNASTNATVAETISLAASKLAAIITEKLNAGRLDHAADYLNRLSLLCADSTQTKDFTYVIGQCRIAADCVKARDFSRALETLRRLRTILPKAKWLDAAIKDAAKAAEAIDDLMVGPLSMLSLQDRSNGDCMETAAAESSNVQKEYMLSCESISEPLEKNFLLQIDGVGSYLVITETPVTIGPVSSSFRPLIGLMAQPNLPVATIDRVEGDYFIRAKETIGVNEKPVTDKLLEDGDKISLSMRCRMKFNVPNAASATAVISLASARLPSADTRSIILMDREILIGSGIKNHIRASRMKNQIVLFKQNGKLLCRTDVPVEVDEKQYDSQKGLTINKPISIGNLTMVLKEI